MVLQTMRIFNSLRPSAGHPMPIPEEAGSGLAGSTDGVEGKLRQDFSGE